MPQMPTCKSYLLHFLNVLWHPHPSPLPTTPPGHHGLLPGPLWWVSNCPPLSLTPLQSILHPGSIFLRSVRSCYAFPRNPPHSLRLEAGVLSTALGLHLLWLWTPQVTSSLMILPSIVLRQLHPLLSPEQPCTRSPQGLCTCRSFCPNAPSPHVSTAYSLTSFTPLPNSSFSWISLFFALLIT